MSGKNQHYIPQSLLRAFRTGPGKIARVFKFQEQGIFHLPTAQVAAEDYFYSRLSVDGSETLDDLITAYESGPLNSDFRAIFEASTGPVEAALAARVIGHLFGRVDHFRGMVRSGVSMLADQIEMLFGGEDQLRYILGADGPLPGPRFREAFGNAIAGNELFSALGLPAPVLEALAYSLLRENLPTGIGELTEHASMLAGVFRENAATVARNAQVKSMTNTLLPEARVNALEVFNWQINAVDSPVFILPDFVALAIDATGDTGTLFSFDMDKIDSVLMPLSPFRMLIGQRAVSPIDLAKFNRDAVGHCFAFFVSAYRNAELEAVRSLIGQRALEPIQHALAEAASDFRRQVEQPNTDTMTSSRQWDIKEPSFISLQVDGLNDATRDALGHILMQLVAWARTRFDLSKLIRFVFSDDYEQAVATIDRGVLDDGQPISVSQEGMSVGYNISVEENGRYGSVIVLRGGLPSMLLGDDDEHYAAAAAIVLSQLARLGANSLIETVFVDGVQSELDWDQVLTNYAVQIWLDYYVGGYQCMFGDEIGDSYRRELTDHLVGMNERLVAARRAYRIDADINALMTIVISEMVGAISRAAVSAASITHDLDAASIAVFREALDGHDLLKWFDLLCADLAEIWIEGEPYPPQESFLVINRHIQRIMAQAGIFLSEDQFGRRVEVPHFTDFEWMAEQAASGNFPTANV